MAEQKEREGKGGARDSSAPVEKRRKKQGGERAERTGPAQPKVDKHDVGEHSSEGGGTH